jgi:hypothetical protein
MTDTKCVTLATVNAHGKISSQVLIFKGKHLVLTLMPKSILPRNGLDGQTKDAQMDSCGVETLKECLECKQPISGITHPFT